MANSSTGSPLDTTLAKDYGKDKLSLQNLTDEYFTAQLPDIPKHRIRTISNYVAETMVLSRGSLHNTQRFAVVLPWAQETGTIVQACK